MQLNYEKALAQIMEYLSYIKPGCTSFSSFSDTKSTLAWVFKSVVGYAFDRGKAIRILAFHREHEGIGRDRVAIGPPGDESGKESIVASREHVHRVRAEALLDLIEAGLRQANVGVVLLPP